jgi:inner membrane protein
VDTVTQIALGAAVGEAVLGRKLGRRAILWGALAGTLPDLDVFIPFGDAVKNFTYHRGASHSLFVLALLTPLMVWLINKCHPQLRQYKNQWAMMIYLVFATHVLLDCFTTYGTQIFWPFVTTPVTWSTIFIIDPLYTLPLLAGVIAALIMTRQHNRGHIINRAGLLLSSAYLSWTVVAKVVVEDTLETALQKQGIAYEKIYTVPAPFNSLLWRAVVKNESGYYEGYYSLLDSDNTIRFQHYPSDESLLTGIEDHWPVQRLQWFTKGFYAVEKQGKDIVMSDLRMGTRPNYVFRFKVGEISNPHAVASPAEKLPTNRNMHSLKSVWYRIWDASVPLGISGKP